MTGFPWPLNYAQEWFEDLYDWIGDAAVYAVRPVSQWIVNTQNAITGFITDSMDGMYTVINTITADVSLTVAGVVTSIDTTINTTISGLEAQFTVSFDWLSTVFSDSVIGLQTGMDAAFSDAGAFVSVTVTDAFVALNANIDAAMTGVSGTVSGLFDSFLGVADDLLVGLGDALGPAVSGMWVGLADGAGAIATGVLSVTDALSTTLLPLVEAPLLSMLDVASDVMGPGSPPKEIKKATEKWAKALEESIKRPIPKKGKSPPDLPTLLAASGGLIAGMAGVYAMTHAISSALDATHPLKRWGFKAAIMDILHTISIDAALGPMVDAPIWAGVIVPMRMRFRQLYPYEVPGIGELARMVTQRIIPDALYLENMSFHAIDATWSAHLRRSNERVPSFGDMSRMLWLGKISMDQLLNAQRHMGIREEFIPGYEALIERLPGAGDLITMMVREVIDLTIFIETMTMQGVSETWSMRHYEAHWILLPLGKVQDARYRGLINDAELAKYLVLHDYKPEPRPGIAISDQELAGKLIWKIPGRIEARWMYKWGDIDQAGLEAFLISDGMDPEWAPIVARATARNQMLAEINRLRDNAKKDYTKGLITEAQLVVNLEALKYSPSLIEFHIADALGDAERELKLEAIDLIGDGYVKDMITLEELESGLAYYIVRPEVLQSELDRLYVTKWRKPAS